MPTVMFCQSKKRIGNMTEYRTGEQEETDLALRKVPSLDIRRMLSEFYKWKYYE